MLASKETPNVDDFLESEIKGTPTSIAKDSELLGLLKLLTDVHIHVKRVDAQAARMGKILGILNNGDEHWLVIRDSCEIMSIEQRGDQERFYLMNLAHVSECCFDIKMSEHSEAFSILKGKPHA